MRFKFEELQIVDIDTHKEIVGLLIAGYNQSGELDGLREQSKR